MINLNAKERILLEDEKSHEQLCVKKYKDAAQKANCPQLKQLFNKLEQQEQQHLNSINQLLSGVLPSMGNQQAQGGSNQQSQGMGNQFSQGGMQGMSNQSSQAGMQMKQQMQGGNYNENDKVLCQDLLTMEKYVSHTYDSSVFEFRDTNVRQVLNHIQKEEQEHGEQIYNYMHQNGMYN